MKMIYLHSIETALAANEPGTIQIAGNDVRLFLGDTWAVIGHCNLTQKGLVMCVVVPPLDELVSTPEARAAGWDRWLHFGPRVN